MRGQTNVPESGPRSKGYPRYGGAEPAKRDGGVATAKEEEAPPAAAAAAAAAVAEEEEEAVGAFVQPDKSTGIAAAHAAAADAA